MYAELSHRPTGDSRLVTSPRDPLSYTLRGITDARTALCRGLADYLHNLTTDQDGGRRVVLHEVYEAWSEPEDVARFPSAVVYSTDAGNYDEASLTPSTVRVGEKGEAIRIIAEFSTTLIVEVWTTDPLERMACAMAMEAAFHPVDWMTGFRLELPHYFSQRATYLPISSAYLDDGDTANERLRRVVFAVMAKVPQTHRVGFVPTLDIRAEATVSDGHENSPGTKTR